jgi:hypothetical protein
MIPRLSLIAIASVFLVVCVGPAFPQAATQPKAAGAEEEPLPSADVLSEKCAKGSGGKEAWAKLKTMVVTGTIEIASVPMSGKIEIFAKSPNKILRVISLADGQFVQKQAFDGQVGWKSDPQSGLKLLDGTELEQAKFEAIYDTDVRLKEVYPDMKVTGRAKVGDRDAYTALTHEPGGKTVTMYLDAQTGLRIAEDSEGPNETGKVEKASVFFEDYRPVSGIQVPYRVRVTAPSVSLLITVQEVRCNVPVDDSVFAMPSAASPAPSNS